MGPTASGKTPLGIQLTNYFPCEIISVDSAMVYRGMDIGTAKPSPEVLQLTPHRLINFLDPTECYSAGQFYEDALIEIKEILDHGKIPLLVGGTMMYFRTLQRGIAHLPKRDQRLRAALQEQGEREGWDRLHHTLSTIDPEAGVRIHPQDSQRIQRALEVFMLTGKTISQLQQNTQALSQYDVINIALAPADRKTLHARIASRFQHMLDEGFEEEVRCLFNRGDLTPELPSMRSVGYRQMWDYLSGSSTVEQMHQSALAATRQLAKRQITWLRSWPEVTWVNSDDPHLLESIIPDLAKMLE